MTKKYITVVFEYVKGAMLPQELIEAFISNRKYKDTVITAVSLESDIEHVEKQNNLILNKRKDSTATYNEEDLIVRALKLLGWIIFICCAIWSQIKFFTPI